MSTVVKEDAWKTEEKCAAFVWKPGSHRTKRATARPSTPDKSVSRTSTVRTFFLRKPLTFSFFSWRFQIIHKACVWGQVPSWMEKGHIKNIGFCSTFGILPPCCGLTRLHYKKTWVFEMNLETHENDRGKITELSELQILTVCRQVCIRGQKSEKKSRSKRLRV